MKARFSLLDGVRFLAAFWVMNFHYLLGLGLSGNLYWYRYGNLGVQLFFIISGFVIVHSMNGKTLREFAIGRFVRLFPLFWVLCTATYLLTLIVPHAQNLHFTEYLVSMTMIGDVFDGFLHHGRLIDPSYWTLGVELIFYIAIGAFVFFFSYKHIRYFLVSWLVISMVAFQYHVNQNFYIKLLLVSHASYFVFGGALALIASKQASSRLEKYTDWIVLVLSGIYATYIHKVALPPYLTPNPYDNRIVTGFHIFFFISIPILVYLSGYITEKRTLKWLALIGGLTYPLYLLHQTMGNTIINYVTNSYTLSRTGFVVCFEILIIAVAYGVYVQDKKMRAWILKKLNGINLKLKRGDTLKSRFLNNIWYR